MGSVTDQLCREAWCCIGVAWLHRLDLSDKLIIGCQVKTAQSNVTRVCFEVIFLLLVGGMLTPAWAASVYVIEPSYQYSVAVPSIRAVDFKNLRLVHFYEGKLDRSFQLKDGKYHDEGSLGGNDLSLGDISYFSPGEGEPEAALVGVDWVSWGGSSSSDGLLQLFEVQSGHLQLIQQFDWDSTDVSIAGFKFDKDAGVLTVTARADDASFHHQPEHVDVVTFKWNGAAFQQVSVRRIPYHKR